VAYKLDKDSQLLLKSAPEELFVGVLTESSRTITLYRADRDVSVSERVVPGHQQLLDLGWAGATGATGFSFQLKGGKLRLFFRNSVLNKHKLRNCLSEEEMDAIIVALELRRTDDFHSYP
jgi:hypothetical protein